MNTAEGYRINIVYSVIDEEGRIVADNKRVSRVVLDTDFVKEIEEVEAKANEIIESL